MRGYSIAMHPQGRRCQHSKDFYVPWEDGIAPFPRDTGVSTASVFK